MLINDDLTFEQYIDMLGQRGDIRSKPPRAQHQHLASELAEGVAYGFWQAEIAIPNSERLGEERDDSQRTFLEQYFVRRWRSSPPDVSFLLISGYLVPSAREGHFTITKAALDLLDKQIYSMVKVFISYRRDESSAFALLLHDRLTALGVDVFLDMESLMYGENWRRALESNIEERDYFVLLLGRKTLTSQMVLQEIAWAYKHHLAIIPIWHNGFRYAPKPALEKQIPAVLKSLLTDTHTLVVEKENPEQYDYTIHRLLRYFDRTK